MTTIVSRAYCRNYVCVSILKWHETGDYGLCWGISPSPNYARFGECIKGAAGVFPHSPKYARFSKCVKGAAGVTPSDPKYARFSEYVKGAVGVSPFYLSMQGLASA